MLAAAFALGLSGCKNSAQVFEDKNEGGFFSKPMDFLSKPDWARPVNAKPDDLTAGPVGPDDLVGADGRCSAVMAQVPVPQPAAPADQTASADSAVGGMAGELSSRPAPAAVTSAPGADAGALVPGGIALGMTECQTVQRAGTPGNVNISAGDKGRRLVVLTYLSGPWPGIYHFADGRLSEIDRAPLPPAPPKAPAKKTTKKKPATPRTSQREFQTVQ